MISHEISHHNLELMVSTKDGGMLRFFPIRDGMDGHFCMDMHHNLVNGKIERFGLVSGEAADDDVAQGIGRGYVRIYVVAGGAPSMIRDYDLDKASTDLAVEQLTEDIKVYNREVRLVES